MAGHPIDYYVYGGSWGTDEGRKIFSEEQMIDRWLKIEAALAEAEAEMGIIPDWEAKEISAKAFVEKIDLNLARAEQQKTRHSQVPVIRAFAKVCGEKAGEYVHFGPTTQDIIDTGNVLALRDVMDAVKRDLEAIEKRLVQITLGHADTPMAGRTRTYYRYIADNLLRRQAGKRSITQAQALPTKRRGKTRSKSYLLIKPFSRRKWMIRLVIAPLLPRSQSAPIRGFGSATLGYYTPKKNKGKRLNPSRI